MSASLPSLLSETAAASRTNNAARPARSNPRTDDAFTAHLREDSAPRSTARPARPTERAARQPDRQADQPSREKPTDEARAEKPAHPADPRRETRDTPARAQAFDRARERSADRATFKRDDAAQPTEVAEPQEAPDEPVEAVAIADANAAETATDAALTIETALASEDEASADAKETAEKNDSALAADTGAMPPPVCPAHVTQEAQPDAAAAKTAEAGTAAIIATSAKQSVAKTTEGGPAEQGGETLKADNDGTSVAPAPAKAPDTPTVASDTHHKHVAKTGGSDNAESRTTRPQQDLAAAFSSDVQGSKSYPAHAGGVQLAQQPVAADSAANLAAPAQPQAQAKAPEAVPMQAVPIAIGLKALEGAREFEIRLDPAELGRVDVKLSISEDGRVQASLVVDRVETLALLQRDARTLERAFDQAGLTADANSIQFSLRQDGSGQQSQRERFDDSGASSAPSGVTELSPAQERPTQLYRGFVRETAVDIRV